MHLTIDELLAYTEEERAKWEAWFAVHGNEPLELAVPMDVHPSVGALIIHCFWAELFYAHWMRDDILSQERMKEINDNLISDRAEEVFAFGHAARKALRDAIGTYSQADWEKTHEVDGPGLHLEGPARKLIAHILVHEIRHWAQVALTIRQHNQTPPGEHDLLFSKSFGPLVRKL